MEFKPSPKLKFIYWLYALPAIVILAFITLLLVVVAPPAALIPLIVLAAIVIILAIWIPRFYNSITYSLENDHAYSKFGVWWKKEKRVPYNLVSEVRLHQGPLQRKLSLANVDVFTPATGTLRPELSFFQVDYELALRLQEELRRRVGILTTKERRVIEEEILKELKNIRSLLEEYLKKRRRRTKKEGSS